MVQLAALKPASDYVATRNACKLCTPLGACLAFSGIEGCVPFLHGSQGCATYIRRYTISHFREPMDIASSNFGEHAAIFGGQENIRLGLSNVIAGYSPKMIGIATTCLSETIGDDLNLFLSEFRKEHAGEQLPELVHVSTASYIGTHAAGYLETIRRVVETLATGGERDAKRVNIIPGIVSPADLRHLRDIVTEFGLTPILLPDYADRLDGATWEQYQRIPPGGTTLEEIRSMGGSAATIEMTSTANAKKTAGAWLKDAHDVPQHTLDYPIGVRASDAFFDVLAEAAGRPTPTRYLAERGRLIDSYVDGHKYLFGKRAIVYGEEDLVVALVAFLSEIGITPVLAASGGESKRFAQAIAHAAPEANCEIAEGVDFEDISDRAVELQPDLLIGNSKGFKLAKRLAVPLVRVGFPIHDRLGGARVQHLAYAGAQQLFDRIVNALLEVKQESSEIGYTYL